jgi:hypothetical protein
LAGAKQAVLGGGIEIPSINAYVDRLIGNPWSVWNDASNRTQGEVLMMLDSAIEAATKDEERL